MYKTYFFHPISVEFHEALDYALTSGLTYAVADATPSTDLNANSVGLGANEDPDDFETIAEDARGRRGIVRRQRAPGLAADGIPHIRGHGIYRITNIKRDAKRIIKDGQVEYEYDGVPPAITFNLRVRKDFMYHCVEGISKYSA